MNTFKSKPEASKKQIFIGYFNFNGAWPRVVFQQKLHGGVSFNDVRVTDHPISQVALERSNVRFSKSQLESRFAADPFGLLSVDPQSVCRDST